VTASEAILLTIVTASTPLLIAAIGELVADFEARDEFLEDVPVADAADRFVRIDGQLYPRARGLLADRTRYTPGFRVRGTPSFEALAVEARFHTLVPTAKATVERSRLSAAELFAILGKLHGETQASRLAVE